MSTKTPKPSKKTEPSLISDNTVVELVISKEVAATAYSQALKHLSKSIKTDGFRKGKVPAHIAEEKLGEQRIIEHALEHVVPTEYEALIAKNKLEPLTRPEFRPIALEKNSEWKLEVHIAQRPTITLGNIAPVIKNAKTAAADAIKEQEASLKKAADSTKDAPPTKVPTQEKLTDEQKEQLTLRHIYQALVEHVKPAIPELLVKTEVQRDLEQLASRLQSVNITIQEYLRQQGTTIETLSNQLAAQALGRLQLSFILDAVATDKKITISDADIKAEITKNTDPKLDDTVKAQQLADQRYRSFVAQMLLRDRVAQHLLSL